jgi:superoxide dismutase, Fe-Mn family
MRYRLKQIYCRPWLLLGLSQTLLESHYENNYGGALRRLNAISEQLASQDYASTPAHVINGLKREELAALNSTLLHELYFASLGGDGKPKPALAEALSRDFGSFDRWRNEFVAMGNALSGGSGWVVLAYIPRDGQLVNQFAAEHTQAVAGGIPILALDMYEHAYHIEFGANSRAYVDAFMRNVDWQAVQDRYEDALKVAPPRPVVQQEFGDLPGIDVEDVRAMLDAGKPLQLIDVRAKHAISRVQEIAVGATWRDPERVQEWKGELSKTDPVVVYCVYGFHVGCRAAIALREAGFDARYMKGGHSGWKAAGGPVKMQA